MYVYVGTYISEDSEVTTSDLFRGTSSAYRLYAGTSQDRTFNMRIPEDLAPGHYTLGLIADYNMREKEYDETNNVASYPIEIVSPASGGAP